MRPRIKSSSLPHRRALPILLWLYILLSAAPAIGAGWTRIGTFDGVKVSRRKIPGQDMPEFRGVAVINARIVEIMAVIDDAAPNPGSFAS
jgi:hypothetical protein